MRSFIVPVDPGPMAALTAEAPEEPPGRPPRSGTERRPAWTGTKWTAPGP